MKRRKFFLSIESSLEFLCSEERCSVEPLLLMQQRQVQRASLFAELC